MLGMIFAAFIVGLVVSMPPGPVVISTGQKAIAGGFWHAFTFNVGSLLADSVYALLVYFGLASVLADSPAFRLGLWVIGGGWLIYLGLDAIRSRLALPAAQGRAALETGWPNFRSGLLMTLFNPLVVVGWMAIAGNFFSAWNTQWPPLERVGLLALVVMLAGAMAWVLLVALVFSRARRYISPRLLRLVSVGSGVFLVVYGLSAWWSALGLITTGLR